MLRELERDAVRHHPFFRAGVDEQQVLLPVVEEAEVALRIGAAGGGGGTDRSRGDGWRHRCERRHGCGAEASGDVPACVLRPRDHRGPRAGVAVGRHEAADAVERLGGDAAAVAQPAGELAVVDRAAAEGRFGQAGLPAIVGDFLQQFLRVHGACPRCFLRSAPSAIQAAWLGFVCCARALTNATNFAGEGQPQNCPLSQWDDIWAIAHYDKCRKMQIFRAALIRRAIAGTEKTGFVGNVLHDLPAAARKSNEIQRLSVDAPAASGLRANALMKTDATPINEDDHAALRRQSRLSVHRAAAARALRRGRRGGLQGGRAAVALRPRAVGAARPRSTSTA